MKILVLLSSFFYSGQTTHVVSLCEALCRMGQEVHLIVTYPNYSTAALTCYRPLLAEAGVHLSLIPADRTGHIVRYCVRHGIEVVHAHSSWDFPLAQAIRTRCGIPYILTCHGLGLNNAQLRRYLEQAACLICVGPRVLAEVADFGRRVELMQNTVDLQRFKPLPKADTFTVVYAARFDKDKAAGIKALGEAIATFPHPIRFIVAGDAGCAKQAGAKAEYVGWESRMEKYMNQAHVVVGTGRAIREGMAAGNACLVLGWRYDGLVMPEDLEGTGFPDFSGRLNKRELSAATIKGDLLNLCEDRDLSARLQDFGRRYAERHFNLDEAAQKTWEIYREACANG